MITSLPWLYLKFCYENKKKSYLKQLLFLLKVIINYKTSSKYIKNKQILLIH